MSPRAADDPRPHDDPEGEAPLPCRHGVPPAEFCCVCDPGEEFGELDEPETCEHGFTLDEWFEDCDW